MCGPVCGATNKAFPFLPAAGSATASAAGDDHFATAFAAKKRAATETKSSEGKQKRAKVSSKKDVVRVGDKLVDESGACVGGVAAGAASGATTGGDTTSHTVSGVSGVATSSSHRGAPNDDYDDDDDMMAKRFVPLSIELPNVDVNEEEVEVEPAETYSESDRSVGCLSPTCRCWVVRRRPHSDTRGTYGPLVCYCEVN